MMKELINPINSGSYKSILDKSPVGILFFNQDGEVVYINDTFNKLVEFYNLSASGALSLNNIFENEAFSEKNISLSKLKKGFFVEKELLFESIPKAGKVKLLLKCSPVINEENFEGGVLILEDLKKADNANHDSGTQALNYLSNILFDYVFVIDSEGIIHYVYGARANNDIRKYVHKNIYEVIEFEQPQLFYTIFEEVKKNVTEYKGSMNVAVDKIKTPYSLSLNPLKNYTNQVSFYSISLYNISSFLEKENDLEKEVYDVKKYYDILEDLPEPLFMLNAKGEILFWNKGCRDLFEVKKDDAIGKYFGKILDLFEEDYFLQIKKEFENNRKWTTIIHVYNNFNKLSIEANFINHRYKDQNIIVVVCKDLTDLLSEHNALRLAEEKYRAIINTADKLICCLNPEGKIIFSNPSFSKHFGNSLDVFFASLIDNEYLKRNTFVLGNDVTKKDLILPLQTRRGKLYFNTKIHPVYINEDIIGSYNVFLNDITEILKKDKDLSIFSSLFEASLDSISLVVNKKIVLANKAFKDLYGYSDDEYIGVPFSELFEKAELPRVEEVYLNILKGKDRSEKTEIVAKRKDGSLFIASCSCSTFTLNNNLHLVIVTNDITEKKRTQQAFIESEEKYRNLIENIDDFLYTFEKIGKYFTPLFYTASVEKITGYSSDELLADTRSFLKIIHPDDLALVKQKIKYYLKSKIQLSDEFETRIISKYGNIIWIRNKVNFIRSSKGELLKVYGLVSDISGRKKAEEDLKKTTDNLIKLNETKDRFLSIISHDLRTPFSSILGFTDLLLHDDDLTGEEKNQYVGFIRDSSLSMLSLVNSLLDWTRLQTGRIQFEPELISATKIIDESLKSLAGAAIKKNIDLVVEVDEDLQIFVDRNLIFQVFNNLISNAIKFTYPNGRIIIKAEPSESARFYEFKVIDNGKGIKKENLSSLFRVDSKFTSDGTAGERGTGLGLSLVKEIIDKHSGSIRVDSEEGKGSSFIFRLPVTSPLILLVDNNKTDRILYSKIIKNIASDYIIEIASSMEEAIEKMEKISPALVISEHQLSDTTGYNLYIEIQKRQFTNHPSFILLASKTDSSILTDYSQLGVEYVFNKPVNLAIFKTAIEKSLKKTFK